MVPSNKATVILAVDVSLSMCSTDIPPNRLEVAKEAASAFVRDNNAGRQVGLVAFAGFAELMQPPTTDLRSLENAISYLVPARRTAIGSAILRSLDAIAEVDNRVEPSELGASIDPVSPSQTSPDSEYSPHIIVLLTDGASNAGPLPMTAAEQAVERGVRVYTIGFGTTNNTSPMNCGDGDLFGFGGFGGGGGGGFGGGGGGFRREIDEETLTQVADMTGGKYYIAESADELQQVFRDLPTYVTATRETTEISVFFTAAAVLLGLLALLLALRWHPLP
jgi:Ca-activated chloride channel family protein